MMNTLKRLEGFAYVTADKEQRDVGATVRQRAKTIHELLVNEDKLKDVRKKGAIQSMRMAGVRLDTTEDSVAEGEHAHSVSSDDGEELVGGTDNVRHERTLSRESTKGVSEEDNLRHVEALKYLLTRPENAICADCGMKGTGCRPTWASISLGVFMCLRCAGIHRSLGVHISQVRSCSLDVWAYHQVEFMARCGGNTLANKFWEHGLDGKPRFLTIGDLESFIREKYVERKYCDEAGRWPPEGDEYMDEEVWTVLKGAMNEQQLADFECRQGDLDLSSDNDNDDGSSEQHVSLIDLLDGGDDLIGDESGEAAHDDDPFGGIDLYGIPQEEVRREENSHVVDGLEWDVSFAQVDTDKGTAAKDKQEDSMPSGAFGNEVCPDLKSNEVNGLTATLEYLGLAPSAEVPKAREEGSKVAIKQMQPPAPNLKPQEKKAHDLLVGALQDFDLAAGIASVSPKALYAGTPKDKGCPMVPK